MKKFFLVILVLIILWFVFAGRVNMQKNDSTQKPTPQEIQLKKSIINNLTKDGYATSQTLTFNGNEIDCSIYTNDSLSKEEADLFGTMKANQIIDLIKNDNLDPINYNIVIDVIQNVTTPSGRQAYSFLGHVYYIGSERDQFTY